MMERPCEERGSGLVLDAQGDGLICWNSRVVIFLCCWCDVANNNLLLDDDDDAAAAVYRFKNKEADEQQATMVDRRRPKNK